MENCLAAAAVRKPALADEARVVAAPVFSFHSFRGFQAGEALGKIGEDFGGYFAATARADAECAPL